MTIPRVGEPSRSQADDGWWVARDEETGIVSQGQTRQYVLGNLDEVVVFHNSQIGESVATLEHNEKYLRISVLIRLR